MSAMVERNSVSKFGSYTVAKFSTASTVCCLVEVETHMQYTDWQVFRS